MTKKSSGCDSPIFIKLTNPLYEGNQPIYSVNVACGKCTPCIKRRVNQWAFRLIQEDRRSSSAYFITLTYDTEHVPLTSKCNMTLDRRIVFTKKGNKRIKSDLQDFFKRLRYYNEKDGIYLSEIRRNNRIERRPIKYYACGEYGGLFGRPHYHAIIFNAFPDTFEKAWTFGNIKFREADVSSIFYTLKYMDKRLGDDYSYDDEIVPEFSIKSKGLGDNYITAETLRHHSSDLDNNYVLSGVNKISLPAYYNRKFWPSTKDEDGRTIPHPHKIKLLSHIKKSVNDTTDKQRSDDIRAGLNPDIMDVLRKQGRFAKNISPYGRKH